MKIGLCHKCANAVKEPLEDGRGFRVTGCKELPANKFDCGKTCPLIQGAKS